MLEVRPARLEDAAILGTIMVHSFRSAFSGWITPETMEACGNEVNGQQLFRDLLSAGQMRIYLGFLNGVPCGEIVWSNGTEFSDSAQIAAVHSLPESWGTGLGSAMLHRALADMGESGKKLVYLWAFKENARGRRFYEKHGLYHDGQERVSEFDGALEVRYCMEL